MVCFPVHRGFHVCRNTVTRKLQHQAYEEYLGNKNPETRLWSGAITPNESHTSKSQIYAFTKNPLRFCGARFLLSNCSFKFRVSFRIFGASFLSVLSVTTR